MMCRISLPKNYISAYLLILILFKCTTSLNAQNKTIDSLELSIKKTVSDSIRTLMWIELAYNTIGYDTLKTTQCLANARNLIMTTPYDYNWGYYYEIKSQYTFHRSRYNEALLISDSAINSYTKAIKNTNSFAVQNAIFRKAVTTADKGASYTQLGDTERGLKSFLKGLELYEQSDHPEHFAEAAACCNNIASLYVSLLQYDKAIEYDSKAVPYHLHVGNDEGLAWAYISLAGDFTRLGRFDSAKVNFAKAEPYVKLLNKPHVSREYYGRLGLMYWNDKDWPKAIEYYTLGYENAHAYHSVHSEAIFLRGVADSHYNLGNLDRAETFALKSLAIDEEQGLQQEKARVFQLMSLIKFKQKDYLAAYQYTVKSNEIETKRKVDEQLKAVADIDKKYKTEQKEKEIIELQKNSAIQALSLQRRSMMNSILVTSLVVLIVISLFVYRYIRQRQQIMRQQGELQQQKIAQLEKDRMLVAVDAMLKGQEEERRRVAQDLHDGLGGMLSGVKLSLEAIDGNMLLSKENYRLFTKVLGQLDDSISEMRRVAHNMMPEALVQLGLSQAIHDYCDDLSESNSPAFELHFHGLEDRFDPDTEIIVYRIVQELLNNIVKHAGATSVLVQIMKHEQNVNITIEDNGCGFDSSLAAKSKHGDGLRNVRSRVDYLKGNCDIQSVPGKGTSVYIDFNVM